MPVARLPGARSDMRSESLRVAVVPQPKLERARYSNPYIRLLGEALADQGVETVGTGVRLNWFRTERSRLDAVHFHWTDLLISSRPGRFSSAATALKAARLGALIFWLRRT